MTNPTLICGAFQGGGAKGIAYAGALKALEERGYGFKAVAGTSAGSIVAALVAARFTSSEVADLIPELLLRLTRGSPPLLSALPDLLGNWDTTRWKASGSFWRQLCASASALMTSMET